MKKRILSLLLAAVLLVPSISACSENSAETGETEAALTPEPSAEDVVVEPEETELSDNLPESDFEGYAFRVSAQDGVYYGTAMIEQALVEEINGNTIVLDFSYIYSNYGGFAWTLMNLMSVNNPTKDFASYYAKNEKVQKKLLEKLQKSFNEMKNP